MGLFKPTRHQPERFPSFRSSKGIALEAGQSHRLTMSASPDEMRGIVDELVERFLKDVGQAYERWDLAEKGWQDNEMRGVSAVTYIYDPELFLLSGEKYFVQIENGTLGHCIWIPHNDPIYKAFLKRHLVESISAYQAGTVPKRPTGKEVLSGTKTFSRREVAPTKMHNSKPYSNVLDGSDTHTNRVVIPERALPQGMLTPSEKNTPIGYAAYLPNPY